MKRLLILSVLVLASGCSSAEWARTTPRQLFKNYNVTMYSGGVAVRTWVSRGKVLSEEKSDGYYFVDDATGRLIEVSGDVVIEQIP